MLFSGIPFFLLAIVGIVYAWVVTCDEIRLGLLGWRRMAALLAVVAVTAQAVLFGILFDYVITTTSVQRRTSSGTWMIWCEAVCFVSALPCILTRRGLIRWWLLYCSIAWIAFTGFAYAISGIVF